jgi:prevent-host-death family protein
MPWQLQEAKQRLSEVVRKALEEGPQVVTRHGRDAVVVVALDEFERLKGEQPDFKAFLRSGPDLDELEIERDRTPARKVEL